jgi:hypothetical protein
MPAHRTAAVVLAYACMCLATVGAFHLYPHCATRPRWRWGTATGGAWPFIADARRARLTKRVAPCGVQEADDAQETPLNRKRSTRASWEPAKPPADPDEVGVLVCARQAARALFSALKRCLRCQVWSTSALMQQCLSQTDDIETCNMLIQVSMTTMLACACEPKSKTLDPEPNHTLQTFNMLIQVPSTVLLARECTCARARTHTPTFAGLPTPGETKA